MDTPRDTPLLVRPVSIRQVPNRPTIRHRHRLAFAITLLALATAGLGWAGAAGASQSPARVRLRVVDGYGGVVGGMAMIEERVVVGLGTRVKVLDARDPRLVEIGVGPAGRGLATYVAEAGNGVVTAGGVGAIVGVLRWLVLDAAGSWDVGEVDLPSRPIALAAREDVAWVVLSGRQSMAIVAREGGADGESADASGPRIVGNVRLERAVQAAWLGADLGLLLLGRPSDGEPQELVVFEATDARAPRELARLTIPEPAAGLIVIGDLAFLPGAGLGYVIDLARPEAPRIAAGEPAVGEDRWWPAGMVALCAAGEGQVVWVGDARPGLMGFDLAEPERPRLVYSAPLREGAPDCRGLVAREGLLLRQDGAGRLQAYDTRIPEAPQLVGRGELPAFYADAVAAGRSRGWALGNEGGALVERDAEGDWSSLALPVDWRTSDIALREDELHLLTAGDLRPHDIGQPRLEGAQPAISLPLPTSGRYRTLVTDGHELLISGGGQPFRYLPTEGLQPIEGGSAHQVMAMHDAVAWGIGSSRPFPALWRADLSATQPVVEEIDMPPATSPAFIEALAVTPRRLYMGMNRFPLEAASVEAWRLDERGVPVEMVSDLDVPGTLSATAHVEESQVALGWRQGTQRTWLHGGVRLLSSYLSDVLEEDAGLDLGAPVADVTFADDHLWLAAGPAGVLVVERIVEERPTPSSPRASPTPSATPTLPQSTSEPEMPGRRAFLPLGWR